MRGCEARQYSDQMQCGRCGLAWDINDPDRPECLSETAVAAQNLQMASKRINDAMPSAAELANNFKKAGKVLRNARPHGRAPLETGAAHIKKAKQGLQNE